MTKNLRIALCAIAALVLAAACGKDEGPKISKNCATDVAAGYCNYSDPNKPKCGVKVEISDCAVKPTTTPDSLHVCRENTKITWTLSASASAAGAKFASNGIDFKGHPEFEHPKPGNTDFEWKDKRSRADPEHPVKYDLHILTKDAGHCGDWDPFVINE